jgi:hypothetical protein
MEKSIIEMKIMRYRFTPEIQNHARKLKCLSRGIRVTKSPRRPRADEARPGPGPAFRRGSGLIPGTITVTRTGRVTVMAAAWGLSTELPGRPAGGRPGRGPAPGGRPRPPARGPAGTVYILAPQLSTH